MAIKENEIELKERCDVVHLLFVKERIIETHIDARFVALNVVQRIDHSHRSQQIDVIILDLVFGIEC